MRHRLTASGLDLEAARGGWLPSLQGFLARLRGRRVNYPLGYMATLDGSRALLAIGVLLAHTNLTIFGGAMVYMDVFFTMSGFLITTVLIKTYDKHGRISLKTFYLRRFLRLYPALSAMVLTLIVLSYLFSADFKTRLIDGLAAWFYLTDYWWALSNVRTLYTDHTWSLSVEEQFYLIWPLLLIGLIKASGITVRTAIVIFALAATFWIWRCVLNYHGARIERLYNTFDARADALLLGCGLAVLVRSIDLKAYPRLWRACAVSLLPITIGMITMVVALPFQWNAGWFYYVSPFFGSIPAAIWVVGLLHPQRTVMHRVYEHPIPVFIGRICYGLYIWHYPIFAWFVFNAPSNSTKLILFVGWPATFVVATLSHYLIERPLMDRRPPV